jgi:hypothetical protein
VPEHVKFLKMVPKLIACAAILMMMPVWSGLIPSSAVKANRVPKVDVDAQMPVKIWEKRHVMKTACAPAQTSMETAVWSGLLSHRVKAHASRGNALAVMPVKPAIAVVPIMVIKLASQTAADAVNGLP